jgi:hypothetical protein
MAHISRTPEATYLSQYAVHDSRQVSMHHPGGGPAPGRKLLASVHHAEDHGDNGQLQLRRHDILCADWGTQRTWGFKGDQECGWVGHA